MRIQSAMLLVSMGGLLACSDVAPTNPFDPATPTHLQAPASITGRVLLAEPGATVEGITVRLFDAGGAPVVDADGKPRQVTVTPLEGDGEAQGLGSFLMGELVPGRYLLDLTVDPRFVAPPLPELSVGPGQTASAGTLRYTKADVGTGRVRGQVALRHAQGGPREVQLYRKAGDGLETVARQRTDAAGRFDLVELPPGTYALSAELAGFTPDFRVGFELVNEPAGLGAEVVFDADDSLVLHPVTAVLEPAVQQLFGEYYTRERLLPLTVLAFGGMNEMRVSTSASFTGPDGEELGFDPYAASTSVPLPAEEGRLTVHAQFRSTTNPSFPFTSPVFTTTIVRDASAPVVVRLTPSGARAGEDGRLWVTTQEASVGLSVESNDLHSAVAGYALTTGSDDTPPDVSTLTFASVEAPGGLTRLEAELRLPAGEGARHAWVWVRDRAGNTSEPATVAFHVDTQAPTLAQPLVATNAGEGNVLTDSLAVLELPLAGECGDEEPCAVTSAVGLLPLPATDALGPYSRTVQVAVPGAHGQIVQFEALLRDEAGNTTRVQSPSYRLEFLGTLQGRVLIEGVSASEPSHAGTRVRLFAPGTNPAVDTPAFETLTAADGRFVAGPLPEGRGYLLVLSRPGARTLEVNGLENVRNQVTTLGPWTLSLSRGEVRGSFRLADLASDEEAHGGILVSAFLGDRIVRQTVTAVDGSYGFADPGLPASRAGTSYTLLATRNGYVPRQVEGVVVEEDVLFVVNESPDEAGVPTPVQLSLLGGDFDLCAASGECRPTLYTNQPTARVRLRSGGSVDEIRLRAREPFGADDALPAWGTYAPGDLPAVDLAGADGEVEVFVQLRSGGVAGPVLRSSIMLDTVAPHDARVTLERGPTALADGYTNAQSVRARVEASPGAGVDVAPLRVGWVTFAASQPVSPPSQSTACAFGGSCLVPLPSDVGGIEEGTHTAWAFACDEAGNCSEMPASASIVYDSTPPSTAHGVALEPVSEHLRSWNGELYTRASQYRVQVEVGSAQTAAGVPSPDVDGEPRADVFGVRFGYAPTLGTPWILFDVPAAAGDVREVAAPALPSQDGRYTLRAQLVDAAGNATVVGEPGTTFDLVLDAKPPAGVFVLNGGAEVTRDPQVTLGLTLPAGETGPAVELLVAKDGGRFEDFELITLPLDQQTSAWTLDAGDGVHTVYARLVDAAGNSADRTASIRLDRTPPAVLSVRCGSCRADVDTGAPYTNAANRVVLLDVLATDESGPVAAVLVSVDEGAAVPMTYAGTIQVALPDADGLHHVDVAFTDRAGNTSDPTRLSILLDRAAPSVVATLAGTGPSALHTSSADVQVQLVVSSGGSPVTGLRVSNTATFSGARQPFTDRLAWTLGTPELDGEKVVYVEVADAAGNVASTSATIVLDRTPPSATLLVEGGAAHATRRDVVATITASDAISDASALTMQLSTDPTFAGASEVPLSATSAFELPDGDGPKVVFLRVRDEAGNVGQASASILLDTQAPEGASLTLPGTWTRTRAISVDLLAPGASSLCLSGDFTGAPADCSPGSAGWAPVAATRSLTLTAGDGLKTLTLVTRDAAGHVSQPASATIVLDTQAPASRTVAINLGETATSSPFVTLSLSATDALSGVVGVAVSVGALDCATASYEPFAATRTFSLGTVDGEKTVTACFRDGAGNAAPATSTIVLDQAAPQGVTLSLAGGASHTTSAEVVAALTATDALTPPAQLQMQLALEPSFAGAAWEPFSTSRLVTLSTDDGVQAVYLRVRDLAGNLGHASDTITLDTRPPTNATLTLSSGAYTRVTGVTASLGVTGATEMCLYGSVVGGPGDACAPESTGWVPLASTQAITLTSGQGSKAVRVRYRDEAGHTAGPVVANVVLDTAAPTSTSVSIDAGAQTTARRQVTLDLAAVDAGSGVESVAVANGPLTCASASYEPFTATRAWTLTAGDGEKTVTVCFRDGAGNSASAFASIRLDATPPSSLGLSLNGGATHTSERIVEATVAASDAQTPPAQLQMELSSQSAPTNAWVALAATAFFELPEGDGPKVVYLHVRDLAGNVSTLSRSIVLDTGVPGDAGLELLPSPFATTTAVSVRLRASDAVSMCLWGDFEGGGADTCPDASPRWEPFAAAKVLTLTAGDGTKVVQARFRDAAGNRSDPVSDSVVLDRTAPDVATAQVELEGTTFGSTPSTALTRTPSVVLRVTGASDATSGLAQMMVSEDPAFANAGWQAWQASLAWTLSAGDGTKRVYVRLRDAAGQESGVVSGVIDYDTTPPNGTVTLAGGAQVTALLPVPVALGTDAVAGATEIQVSWTGVLPDPYTAARSPFVPSTALHPPAGDGLKTLYVRLFDAAGNYVERSASVTVDTTPPSANATAICQSCTVSSTGTRYFRSEDGHVELALFASDASGVASVEVVVNGGAPQLLAYAPVVSPFISLVEAAHTVDVTFLDAAGNRRSVPPLELVYDVTPPALTVVLDAGALVTRFSTAHLAVVSDGTDSRMRMFVSSDPSFAGAAELPFASSLVWSLPAPQTEGTKTVHVRLLDVAGNSTDASDDIELDFTPPSNPSIELDVGDATNGQGVVATLSATGATEYRITGDVVAGAGTFQWRPMQASAALTLLAGDGPKEVHVTYRDPAGNVSDRATASTVLDKTPPVLVSATLVGSNVNGSPNADATATLDVQVRVEATGAAFVAFSTGAAPDCAAADYDRAWAQTLPVTLTAAGVLHVCVRDEAGNTAGPATGTITVDLAPPSCSITLKGRRADGTYVSPLNDTHTASTTVEVESSCTGDPVELAVVPAGHAISCATASYATFAASFSATVPAGDGSKNVLACFRDHVGNYTATPVSADVSLILDQTPPDNARLFLATSSVPEPATHTSSRTVYTFLSASGADQMARSTTGVPSGWSAYSESGGGISLPALSTEEACALKPDGVTRTVYARFRDELRNVSPTIAATIVLDQCAPGTPTVTVAKTPGAISNAWMNSRTVTASIGNRAGAARMWVLPATGTCPTAIASYVSEPVAGTTTVTFAGDGSSRLCVRLEDAAGNLSTAGYASFTIDTIPPLSPTLSPSNLTNVNRSCADITPGAGVDANFNRWQTRMPGGAWQDTTLTGSALRFTLQQDRDNQLEVRAIDNAGNVGESNAAFVQEVSSVLVPTDLTMKSVCGSGRYLLLKDMSVTQTIATAAACGTTGRNHSRLIGRLPRHELLDLNSLATHRLDGAGGLASSLGSSYYRDILDAACSPTSEALLVTHLRPGAYCADYTTKAVNLYVYPDPIDDPSASAYNGAGPIKIFTGAYSDSPYPLHDPTNTDVDLAITSIDALNWTSTTNWTFNALATNSALGIWQEIRKLESWSSFTMARASARYDFVANLNQYYIRGLAVDAAGAANWMKYENSVGWQLRHATGAGTNTETFFTFPQSAGFGSGGSPWGSRVKPSPFWYGGGNFTYVDSSGNSYLQRAIYDPSNPVSSYRRTIGTNAPANTYPAFFDHSSSASDWVDAYDNSILHRANNYVTQDLRQFRYPVDTSRPILSTMKDGAGQPFVAYHTVSNMKGVVIGYEDETGCAQ